MQYDLSLATAVLTRTPGTLRALLAGLPDDWTRATEGGETWSPTDVVGHLLHLERSDWIHRAEIILAQGPDRRFPPVDRTAMLRESPPLTLEQRLDAFAEARAGNLRRLADWRLSHAQLALTGEHPALGTVTLAQLLSTWVAHDLSHLAQIARVMAKQYRDAVGPWAEYLSVMRR